MISFKGAQYPKGVILFAVFFYVRYGVSCRDLEECRRQERGKHSWNQGNRQDVEGLWMPDTNQDGQAEVFEQHRLAEPPVHQEANAAHAGVQSLCFCCDHAGWDRGVTHDPQRAIRARTLPVSSILGTGRLTRGQCAISRIS